MKTQKHAGRLLAQFRKAIGKSQTQFATMLGVSKHTIISVENGRNRLSPKLARRIQIATGAPVYKESDLANLDNWLKDDRFTTWRQKFQSNEATALERFEDVSRWIGLVFRAAARSGVAGNRDRLPAVYLSMVEWLEETRTTFKLEREIDDILEEETRHLKHGSWNEMRLREDDEFPAHDQWVARQLGISVAQLWKEFNAHKKAGKLVELHAELEAREVWEPHAKSYPPSLDAAECRVRKLAEPKYWFESLDRPSQPKS